MKPAYYAYLSGASLMLLAVGFGAFGAHAFADILAANGNLSVYDTASQYHFYHALGLLLIGTIAEQNAGMKFLTLIVSCLFFGVLIFSGSLYALAIFDIDRLGAITPIGGLVLLTGWASLVASLLANKITLANLD